MSLGLKKKKRNDANCHFVGSVLNLTEAPWVWYRGNEPSELKEAGKMLQMGMELRIV